MMPDAPGTPPTAHQLHVFEVYLRCGSQKAACGELRMPISTLKNTLSILYAKLGAHGALEAALVLGWVQPGGPAAEYCGWLARCTRPAGHRGQHGGFRALPVQEVMA